MKKTLAWILVLVMAVALVACSGGETDQPASSATTGSATASEVSQEAETGAELFRHYSDEQWLAESFDGKEIAYQLVSHEPNLDSMDYGFAFSTCINLYADGSAVAYHRNIIASKTDRYFGFWTLTESEYGNEIALTVRRVVAVDGVSLLAHKYDYTLYEEEDGNYSFSFDFGITPGAYFRQIGVSGGKDILYPTPEDFYEAVDMVIEMHRFESAESNNGFTAQIHVYSDNTVLLSLYTEYNGANTAVANADGTLSLVMNEANTEVTGYRINATHDALGDVTIDLSANFEAFVWNVGFMGADFTFDMQPVEIPAE